MNLTEQCQDLIHLDRISRRSLGGGHPDLKTGIEIPKHVGPFNLARLNLIEEFLHAGSELDFKQLIQVRDQHGVDLHAQFRRLDRLLLLGDVATVIQGSNERGIGAGATHAILLKSLDQGGFTKPARGLGFLALLQPLDEIQQLPFLK